MSNIYEQFGTNKQLESDGIDLEIAPGVRFTVKRMGSSNKKYQQLLAKLSRPYKRQMDNGTLDDEIARKMLRMAFIQTVLIGWDGVTNKKGKMLDFNVENADSLFSDLPDLFDTLSEEAQRTANFLDSDGVEEVVKN